MLKDLTTSHFWTLTRMGMDMQRMWDFNYSVDGKTAYIDYKEFYGYEGGSRRKKKCKRKGKGKNKKKTNNGVKENNNANNQNNITVTGENTGENVNEANMEPVVSDKPSRGKVLYEYTRYKIYLPKRQLQRTLSVIGNDEYDYDKYFEQNHLAIM